jgi:hypothetical protein
MIDSIDRVRRGQEPVWRLQSSRPVKSRRPALKSLLFLGFLTVPACSGRPLGGDETPNNYDSSVSLTATMGGDASVPPRSAATDGGAEPICDFLPASPLCSQNPTGPVAVSSMSDLVAAMSGRWLLCGTESVFAANGGDVGLEITADNHWYRLYPAPGGATVRGAGFDQEGTWSAIDLGGAFQVNFDIFGSGTVITVPVFASTPRAMRLNNEGVFVGNYVIDPTVPAGSQRCAPPLIDASAPPNTGTADGGLPACAASPASALCSQNPTGPVAVGSTSDLLAVMPGRWLLCGNESVFAMNGGDVGLDITPDNHWYKLFPAEGAATIRGAGFDEEGTWAAIDLGDHIQVNFEILGSGTIITAPVFASTPQSMRLDNEGVFVGNYVIDATVPTGTVRCTSAPHPTIH